MLNDLLFRLRALFRRESCEKELKDELQFHVERQASKYVQSGMRPEQAERQARLDLGGVEQVKEHCRDARGIVFYDAVMQDLRYSVRLLLKKKGFAFVAVVTVAVGIAATTAVFNLVDTMLLEPPEFVTAPDELFGVYLDDKKTPDIDYRSLAYPQYDVLMKGQDVADLTFHVRGERLVTINDRTELTTLYFITGNFFPVYGVSAGRGRAIELQDDEPGAPFVGMISYDFWQTRFGGVEDIIGRTFKLAERDFTIIGVAPQGYVGTKIDWLTYPQIWIPLQTLKVLGPTPGQIYRTRGAYMPVGGRLKPGISMTAAEARMNVLAASMNDPSDPYHVDAVHLVPIAGTRVDPTRRDMITNLLGALVVVSALVLIGACFNVANFLIGQVATRKTEVAVRFAMGASRRRIVGQLFTESLVLAVFATSLGLVLAAALLRLVDYVPVLFGRIFLRAGSVLDIKTIVLAAGLTIFCSLAFGLLPAISASARNPWNAMRRKSAPWKWAGVSPTPRQVVLAIQVTLSVVLAFAGTLFARSFYEMITADVGFATGDMMTGRLDLSLLTPEERKTFGNSVLTAARAIPGVRSAMLTSNPPMDGGVGIYRVIVPEKDNADHGEMYFISAPPGYFRFLSIPLLAGREYEDSAADQSGSIIINRILAEQLWPGESAIGKSVHLRHTNYGDITRQVIGVSPQDNCWNHLSEPQPCIYSPIPSTGSATGNPALVLRVRDHGAVQQALRQTIRGLNPKATIHTVRPLNDMLWEQMSTARVSAIATGALAALGVLLSAIGCFAVFSSLVKQNTREIAIRIALGAPLPRLMAGIILPAVAVSAFGIAAGLGISVLSSGYLQDLFFKTNVRDGVTLITITAVVIAIAVLASYIPARTAARTDPAAVLKL